MIFVKLIFLMWYMYIKVLFCDYMYIVMIGCFKRIILIENVIVIEYLLFLYSNVCKND